MAENDDDLRMLFSVDEVQSLLQETGYKKPVTKLSVADKTSLRSILIDYHCMVRVKACMDQFAEGLEEL